MHPLPLPLTESPLSIFVLGRARQPRLLAVNRLGLVFHNLTAPSIYDIHLPLCLCLYLHLMLLEILTMIGEIL